MEPYKREGDSQTISVPFPWNESSKASLKNHFILKNVFTDIFMSPRLPEPLDTFKPFIDTLVVNYTLYSPADTGIKSRTTTKFVHVINDSLFRKQSDITAIVNTWPDSLRVKVDIEVPVGTRLRAVNDLQPGDADYAKYIGRMNIKAVNTVRMNAVLHWQVDDTTSIDLGSGRFEVPQALRYFNKMDRKLASFNMDAYNNTNVYMDIYALVAPKNSSRIIDSLDSLPTNRVWAMISDTALARQKGFVSFLGTRGVRIPPRNSTIGSKVELNDWQLRAILGADSCAWRWIAHFLPKGADALHDSDYIKIDSWLRFEGDNNMDSLLIWE
jgi:hypothetical protein